VIRIKQLSQMRPLLETILSPAPPHGAPVPEPVSQARTWPVTLTLE